MANKARIRCAIRRSTAESMRSLRCTQDWFQWEGPPARADRTATAPTSPPDGSGPQQRLFVAAASACEPLRAAAHTIQDEMIYRFG